MPEGAVRTWSQTKNNVQRIIILVVFFVLIGIGLWVYHHNIVNIRQKQVLCSELKTSVQCLLPLCSRRLRHLALDGGSAEGEAPALSESQEEFLRELEELTPRKYFFVLDKKGQAWMNGGNRHLSQRAGGARPGTSLFALDPERKKPVEDLVSTALQGGGFAEYEWNCPEHDSQIREKISYIERIPQTGLFIGRGVYM